MTKMGGNNNMSTLGSSSSHSHNTQQRSLRKMVKNARWAMEKRDESGKRPSNNSIVKSGSRRGGTPEVAPGYNMSNEYEDEAPHEDEAPQVPAYPYDTTGRPRAAMQRRGSTGGGVPLAYFGGSKQPPPPLQPQPHPLPAPIPRMARRQSTGTFTGSQPAYSPSTTPKQEHLQASPNITLSLSGRWNTSSETTPSVRIPPRRASSRNSSELAGPTQPSVPSRHNSSDGPPQLRMPSRSSHTEDSPQPLSLSRSCHSEGPPKPRFPTRSAHGEGPPPQPKAPIRRRDTTDSSSGRRSQDAIVAPPPPPTMTFGVKPSFRVPASQPQQAPPPSPTPCIPPFRAPLYHVIQEESHDSFNSSVSSMTLTDSSSMGKPARDRSVTPLPLENEDEEVEEGDDSSPAAAGQHGSDCSLMSDLSSSINELAPWAPSGALGVMAT